MSKIAIRTLVLGLVHQGRSFATARGIQGAFQQGIRLDLEVQPVLDELLEERRLTVAEGTYSVAEAGYRDLHRANFEDIFQQVKPLVGQPVAFQQLIQKIIHGKPLPKADDTPQTFEFTGKFYNTTPLILGDALGQVVGRSHGGPKISIVEDQVIFEDGNFDLLIYSLAQARYDDSIAPGRDNFRLKATYQGTTVGLENLVKKFAQGLEGHGTRYELQFYQVDEEGDVVGEEFEFYSA